MTLAPPSAARGGNPSEMKRWHIALLLVTLGSAGVALAVWGAATSANRPVIINETAAPPLPTLDTDRVRQGTALYAQHCAACHGANLVGAPNWKQPLADGSYPPPPHDSSGHTWHHPDSLLLSIVQNGGDPAYNSKMPAFKAKLSAEEMRAVLEFIKSHWGQDEREFQWWITATSGDT